MVALPSIFIWVVFVFMLMTPLAVFAQDDTLDVDAEDEDHHIQRVIDSLLADIKPGTPDSIRAKNYCHISLITNNLDTCLAYAFLSMKYCKDTDTLLIADNQKYIAWAYWMKDDARRGLPHLLRSTALFEKTLDISALEHNYRFLSKFYDKLAKSDSSKYYINKAMELSIKHHDTTNIAQCYIDLSEFYMDRKFYAESEKNLRKAIELDSLINDTLEYARCYYRLGELCCVKAISIEDLQETMHYLKKAIKIFEDINSNQSIYISTKHLAYGDLANVYIQLANHTKNDKYADSCLTYLKRSLDYLIKQNNYSNAVAIGYTYFEYFKYYKRYKEALAFLQRLEKYFTVETTKLKLRDYYDKLCEAYILLDDYKNAYGCIVKKMEYNDAVINDSTMAALATLKTEQAMIIENNNRQHDEEVHFLERRKLWSTIILLCVVLVLVCVLVFYIARSLRIRKNNNAILMLKNEMLNQQKTEILAQRDEIESQKNEIEIQKNIITEQWQEVENVNKNLIHSINYAQRIQRAAVSKIEEVRAIFPDSFVFFRPRDIVSGDFYRCGRCGKYAVMITADCTGHGIPGAFLSMLGLSGLKEFMVTEADAEKPGTVLDRMKEFVKSTLVSSQKGKIIDDGMDMTICCYDFDKMVMHYAIAGQTAYIIRNGEAIKLKGDPMPVGHYVRETDNFQNLTIDIQKSDMIYTFSDGIQDQLGSQDKRKFMLKNLVKLLVSIATKPTDTQAAIIEQSIATWRGNTPQVDDMTLVGIRV